jgi:ABC-type multidrug transport system permease subunit
MLAIFVIPENFTSSLYELMSHPAQFAANFTNVELWLDYGDYVVTQVVEDKLEKSLQQLLSEYFGTSMRLYNTRQIYGDSGTQYVRYIAAGYLAYTAFCFAMFVTVLTFFWERRHGCLRRGFSMGLRPWVLVFSHMLIYSLICVIQSSVMLIATLSFFDLQVYGNYGLLLVMLWLVAIAGLSTGLLVSGLSSSEVTAIQVSVALSFLLLSLGGILWPLASVSTSISWISDLLPVTWAASGIRDIYTRNWGLEQRAIMLALVVPIAWTIISIFILMIFVLRPSTRLWTTFTCCRKRGLTN